MSVSRARFAVLGPLFVSGAMVAAACTGRIEMGPVAGAGDGVDGGTETVVTGLVTPPAMDTGAEPLVATGLLGLWRPVGNRSSFSDQSGNPDPKSMTVSSTSDGVVAFGDVGVVLDTTTELTMEIESSSPVRTVGVWAEAGPIAGQLIGLVDVDGTLVEVSTGAPADGCVVPVVVTTAGTDPVVGCADVGLQYYSIAIGRDRVEVLVGTTLLATLPPLERPGDTLRVGGSGWAGLIASVALFETFIGSAEVNAVVTAGSAGMVSDAPVIAAAGDAFTTVGSSVTNEIQTFHPGGRPITFSADLNSMSGATLVVDEETAVFEWTPAESDVGRHFVEVVVDDGQRLASAVFVVEVVHRSGTAIPLAGSGSIGTSGDGGPAEFAGLNDPGFVTVAADGTVIIADYDASRLRVVDGDGTIRTLAGTGAFGFGGAGLPATETPISNPTGMSYDPAGGLVFSDHTNHRIRRIAPDGTIEDIAGTGFPSYLGDGGPAVDASLNDPEDIVVAADGTITFTDQSNHVVRQIDTDGRITTIAGTGSPGSGIEGEVAIRSPLTSPSSLTLDRDGNVIFSDERDHVVWRIDEDGILRRLAGIGEAGFSGDGASARGARLNQPTGVAVDDEGLIYIADTSNARLRIVDSSGRIWTLQRDGLEATRGPSPLDGIESRDLAWDDERGRLVVATPDTGQVWLIEGLG